VIYNICRALQMVVLFISPLSCCCSRMLRAIEGLKSEDALLLQQAAWRTTEGKGTLALAATRAAALCVARRAKYMLLRTAQAGEIRVCAMNKCC